MTDRSGSYAIPDVELPRYGGGTVNPADFAGHLLVVTFLPADAAEADRAIEAHAARAAQFSYCDAWLIAVSQNGEQHAGRDPNLVDDRDGRAWTAFAGVAGEGPLDRSEGATFLFGRGGTLLDHWPGTGNVDQLVEKLGETGFGDAG